MTAIVTFHGSLEEVTIQGAPAIDDASLGDTPDHADDDDDEDGVADGSDERPYDTDDEGMKDLLVDEDDDGDGLPDHDEDAFGTSRVRPDTDADRQTDYEEWIAGTQGTNPASFFAIRDMEAETGAPVTVHVAR